MQGIYEEYDQLVREKLSEKRYRHSIAVMERAVVLAEKFNVDTEKARLAGLLHDVMKDTENKILLQFVKNSDILLRSADYAAPQLWHAIAGYLYLRDELKITDDDVLQAVRYHTTGRAKMSPLEKVVYLADLTSADRDYADIGKTRKLTDKGLEQGLLHSMKFLIKDLTKNNKMLHPDTIDCYNELVSQGTAL